MKKINDNMEKYFKSARNYKSSFSKDDVRSLLEKSDLYKSKKSFFNKKGIKSMTIISMLTSSLLVGLLLNGNFDAKPQNNAINSKTVTNTKELVNANADELTISAPISEQQETPQSKLTSTNISKKVQGLNRIILNNKELADFGVFFGKEENQGKIVPFIGYISKMTSKMAFDNRFYKKWGSSFRNLDLPLNDKRIMLEVDPNFITSYNGDVRSKSQVRLDESEQFVVFHNELLDFMEHDFKAIFPIDSLPNEFQKQLDKLNSDINKYQANKLPDNELAFEIKSTLNKLNQIVKSSEKKFNDVNGIVKDTGRVITMFPEDINDTSLISYQKEMAEQGIKVIFEKQPVSMKSVVESINSNLASTLSSIQEEINNYIMFSKMIAIEIPFKDDKDNDGLIFWYVPSEEILAALPERISKDLRKEFKQFERSKATCGAKIDVEKVYMDIWRACDGAIENLMVFPNPIQDDLSLKFNLNEARDLSIAIYDLAGNELLPLQREKNFSEGKAVLNFNISKLQSGMYMIVVSSSNGENAVQRIIKK